jgi:hypothetical protein
MENLPEGVPELLDLFAHSLADVRFGDLDATVLTAAASEVTEAASAVALAARALETARASLLTAQDALVFQANRALAYARVFAETDEALLARVNAITLPRARIAARKPAASGVDVDGAAPSRPRGRPRKIASAPASHAAEDHAPLAQAGE